MGIKSLPPNAGTSRIKKRIRDLERLIKKPNLSANKKTEAERAVEVFKSELENAEKRKVEIKSSKKYHMVKFFEKKKALRALKKEDAGDNELANFYYITLFPKNKKYSALYADDKEKNHWFLTTIREKMKTGELKGGKEGILEALSK